MTIDMDVLNSIRQDYIEVCNCIERYPSAYRIERIRQALQGLDLDIEQDCTYELLQDGLTKQTFDELELLSKTYLITQTFLQSQNLRHHKYANTLQQAKHEAVTETIRYLSLWADDIGNNTFPDNTDPYHHMTIMVLVRDYQTGDLHDYCNSLAVDAAIELHTDLNGKDERLQFFSASADKLLGIIKTLPLDKQNEFFEQTDLTFEELLQECHEHLLNYLSNLLEKQSDPKPQWSTGHLSDYTYQFILDKLTRADIDIHNEQTYQRLGTDQATFWANYQVQYDWLSSQGNNTQTKYKPKA